MKQPLRFAALLALFYALALSMAAVLSATLWIGLDTAERAAFASILEVHAALLICAALLALAALGMLFRAIHGAIVAAPQRLADEIQIMIAANPAHRAAPAGPAELRSLAAAVNQFAALHEAQRKHIDARIAQTNAELEAEKNRLAALMAQLAQSVLVCNNEGRILLYNPRARRLLTGARAQRGEAHAIETTAPAGTEAVVGLGRSLFAIIDRDLVVHAFDSLNDRMAHGEANPVSSFVTTTHGGQLLRVQMAPVVGHGESAAATPALIDGAEENPGDQAATQQEISGYVLTLDDVRLAMEQDDRRGALLQSLTEGTRAALANIRAAVENLLAFPQMTDDHRRQFTAIIDEEACRLSAQLDRTLTGYADYIKTQWPLEAMLSTDLIAACERAITQRLGTVVSLGLVERAWLRADSYSLVQAVTAMARRLKDECAIRQIELRFARLGQSAHLDLVWNGAPLAVETALAWENATVQARNRDHSGGPSAARSAAPLASLPSYKEVAERHGGEAWYKTEAGSDRAAQRSYFRMLLPLVIAHAAPNVIATRASRPEFYDFDLFHQPGQTAELDQRKLSELSYTVFDTETTGLEPSAGDEIISIGAIRIVNGRLLRDDVFDQLVDPKRPLSAESIRVHGIAPAMLAGQPAIDQVLPVFQRFCEDTVLVAHNAAFDMRFLQLKESSSKVRFTNPLLDTLLLSAVAHPNHDAHRLEAIAGRLGVSVVGRHTALGDAIVTAEVFLKLIALLAEQGITTLRDARAASEKTLYARVSY